MTDILTDPGTIGFCFLHRNGPPRTVLVTNISDRNVAIWDRHDEAIPIAAGGSTLLDLFEGGVDNLRNTTKFFVVEELPTKFN
jgi:hypothetical protein